MTATIVDQLQRHATEFPGRRLYTFLGDGESEAGSLTYGELDRQARSVASALLELAMPGDRAVLLYPVGLEYLVGFFGCLYAGLVAVPAYPLRAESRSNDRIGKIISDCTPRLVLTCDRLVDSVRAGLGDLRCHPGIVVLGTEACASRPTVPDVPPSTAPEMLAFLQYTSASTADAKGVRITHGNLMANEAMIQKAMGHDETSHFVSWLPPYHDMGLVGNLLQPLYLGASCAFMPPAAFVQRPRRWLEAIARYGARTTGAPNFAYALCVHKIHPGREEPLDLRTWTIAYCGAEVVDANVFERFAEHFAPWGFRRSSFYPCYGLAEVTLMASGSERAAVPSILNVDAALLDRRIVRDAEGAGARRLVGCGPAVPGSEIRIVDPASLAEVAEGNVGEIWIRGPHVAAGYWDNPAASEAAFGGQIAGDVNPHLRTGDLGTLVQGRLYVVGRIKEIIIHQGRTLYPTDIENTVEECTPDAIEAAAAFAVPGEDTEDVVVVIEVARRPTVPAGPHLGGAIAWDLYRTFEIVPARLVFVKRGAIPRTSSGKKQRLLCAQMLAQHTLDVQAEWVRATDWADGGAGDGGDDPLWLAKFISGLTGIAVTRLLDPSTTVEAWSLDSLRAVEIVHYIERRTGVVLPVTMFYEARSLDSILLEIEQRVGTTREEAGTGWQPAGVDGPDAIGVIPGQEAIWFAQQVNPTSPAFHLKWALRVAGGLDPNRLCEAVRTVLSRHDILRCVFGVTDGAIKAHTLPAGIVDYEYRNGDIGPPVDWINEACDMPYRIDQDLLVRVRQVHGRDFDLVGFSVHHLISDLWSCALLTEEIFDEYAGVEVAPVPPYSAYVRHVRALIRDGEAHLDYWRSQLTNRPRVDPVDVMIGSGARPPVRSYVGESVAGGFDAAASHDLLAAAQRLGVSRQVLLFSIYGLWWWTLTRLEDFLSGGLTSGRTRSSFSRMQGMLTNLFAVRFRISPATTLGDLVGAVRAQVLGAIEHESCPFAGVVRTLSTDPELGRRPFFQNMFVYQQLPASSRLGGCVLGGDTRPFEHRGLRMTCVPLPKHTSRYDFTLYAMEASSAIAWEAVYDPALLRRADVTDALVRFDALARTVARAGAETRVEELGRPFEIAV